MKWVESFFVDNARTYTIVLESMWKNGEEGAKLLSDLFKEKGLKGCRVLDVPCGIGRVGVPLAKLRFSVKGVDISPYFIRVARKKARQFGVARRTSFVVGQMKDVNTLFPRESFDAAININTSIGYESEHEDLVFFKNLRQVVRKGGLFIIGALASRDYLFSHFIENIYDETDRLVVLEKNELDVSHSKMRSKWRFYLKKGGSLRYVTENPFELRLYSPHELVGLLEKAGWKVSATYDSLTYRRPYSPDNHSITVVAEAV